MVLNIIQGSFMWHDNCSVISFILHLDNNKFWSAINEHLDQSDTQHCEECIRNMRVTPLQYNPPHLWTYIHIMFV
jgi:hypothetical protein